MRTLTVFAVLLMGPSVARAANSYSYDQLGRLTSVLYGNGSCVAYAYDAAGNRSSVGNVVGGEGSTWSSGVWGCFRWTAP